MPRLIACAVLAVLVAVSPALAGDFINSGQTSTINAAGNGFPCFDSPDSFDAYWDAKRSGDSYGTAQAKQNAVILRPGWHVRLLGADDSDKQSRIRIESGPKAGTASWLKFNPAGIVNA